MEKRFIYPYSPNQQHFIIDLNGQFHNLQNGSGGDDYVVQQYTGLNDKDNNPIFDGDIVKQIHFDDWDDQVGHIYAGVVKHTKYCDDCDNQISKFATFIEANQNSKFSAGNPIKVDCEIIGNIFENPELIKT